MPSVEGFKMCYQRMMKIRWVDKVTNKLVNKGVDVKREAYTVVDQSEVEQVWWDIYLGILEQQIQYCSQG